MRSLYHVVLSASISLIVASSMVLSTEPLWAGEEEDLAEMQRQLNADVMAQPFDPADVARVDAYIEQAMKDNLKPETQRPDWWQPGYTCRDAYRYGYRHYRNCRYYHRYYGRYW